MPSVKPPGGCILTPRHLNKSPKTLDELIERKWD